MTLVSLRRNVHIGARGEHREEGTLARNYKLRLSDGTILAVDLEGLTVWLMDKRAMVQVAGAKEWRPLKEVIAEARVAAKYAAREQAEAGPKKKRKKRGGRDALPLVPPPSGPAKSASPSDAPVVESISPEDAMIGVPQGVQSLADDPVGPGAAAPVDETPVIPLKPLGGAAPRRRPREDEPIGAADEPGSPESMESAVDESPGKSPEDAAPHFDDPSASGPFAGAFIDEEPDTRPPKPAPVVPVAPPPEDAPALRPAPSDDDVSRLLDSIESARVDDALLGAPPDLGALASDPPPTPEPPTPDPPAPVVEEPAAGLPTSGPEPASEDLIIGAPEGVQALADEPVAPAAVESAEPPPAILPVPDAAPAVGLEGGAPPEAPARVRVVVRDPVTRTAPVPGGELVPPLPSAEPPPAPGSPQVLADEVVGSPGSRSEPVSSPVDRLPVIPMKSRDDETSPSPEDGAGGAGGLGAMLLAAVGAVGALFSRLLNPISRLERGEPLVDDSTPPVLGPSLEKLRTTASGWAGGVRERAGRIAERASRSGASAAEAATLPAAEEEGPSRLASTLHGVTSSISSWIGALTERVRRLAPSARDEEPPLTSLDSAPPSTGQGEDDGPTISPVRLKVEPLAASLEPEEAAPPSAPLHPEPPAVVFAPATPPPAPRTPRLTAPPPAEPPEPPAVSVAPLTPQASSRETLPPPTGDLDVVPFVESIEPREEEDVYEGDGSGDFLGAAWAWTKSLLLLGVAAAVVVFAVVNWRTWFPTAAELGEATFTEVDRVAKSAERAEQLQQAVAAAVPELPHLGPETIRLVLSSNPTGLPVPSEAFRIAGDAADRGLGTLTVGEANELEDLRVLLRDGLGPLEREQLEGYAQTRARRIVFPAEYAHALALVARGTRTLPPESRTRLQALLGKAIAAGIGPPVPPATSPLPRTTPDPE